jgi:hypothetical protein
MYREYTKKIIEMVDEGILDRDETIRDLLNWMSEKDVKEFYESYGSNENEDDGQPDEILEWYEYDGAC